MGQRKHSWTISVCVTSDLYKWISDVLENSVECPDNKQYMLLILSGHETLQTFPMQLKNPGPHVWNERNNFSTELQSAVMKGHAFIAPYPYCIKESLGVRLSKHRNGTKINKLDCPFYMLMGKCTTCMYLHQLLYSLVQCTT